MDSTNCELPIDKSRILWYTGRMNINAIETAKQVKTLSSRTGLIYIPLWQDDVSTRDPVLLEGVFFFDEELR